MKISIVTISYNQRKFLSQALDSVLLQNYPDLDYVVVDPGSLDGSREEIFKRETRLNTVIFESDKGPADGLRKGFCAATGDIYGFINADDMLLPGSLSAVGHFFAKNLDVDMLLGDGFVIDEHGAALQHVKSHSFSLGSFFHGGSAWLQQSIFFRRNIYEKVGGFNVDNRTSWDGELFLRMLQHGAKVSYLNKDIACFRLHDASITGSSSGTPTKFLLDRNRVFREITGREWNRLDDAIGIYYRLRSMLIDPSRIQPAFSKRFRGKHK